MPDRKDISDYNFIKRSKQLLEKYLLLNFDTLNFNYTNLCFFRTPTESILQLKDYEKSLPLFKHFVDFISPPLIFSMSNNNYKVFLQLKQLTDIKECYDSEHKHKEIKAKLWGYNFYSVPHPNARVKGKSRNEIWEHIGNKL